MRPPAAAEQLGSDKAPVRLTALCTLERLADDNRRHRQTIANIICAYLRMPYVPPPAAGSDRGKEYRPRAGHTAQAGGTPSSAAVGPDPAEELQVRLTAQRILQTHLRPDADVALAADLSGPIPRGPRRLHTRR